MQSSPPQVVMVLEDDASARRNLMDIVELDGFEPRGCVTFAEAFQQTDWQRIVAVVLDRQLPDGLAENMVTKFRQLSPETSLIVVTGYGDVKSAVNCLRQGAEEYLLKPVDPDVLRTVLARVRERRASHAALQQSQEELKRRTAQLHQADRLASIGTLAAGLGHDMNNVLLPMRARLDALNLSELPEKAREHFHAFRRSIEYLQQLSDGLHLLALDPDDEQATSGKTSIGEWWQQVGPLLRKSIPKSVRFEVDLPPNLPEVQVAPHRLTQAVLNLVVNAGEAVGNDGQVRIWSAISPDQQWIRVGVTDNGEGMSAEVRKRALDPFFTTKKRGLGTGLGLSLVHGVARRAGGEVEIDSDPGRGTTVALKLPCVQRHAGHIDDGTAGPIAVVSIQDQRAASLVTNLLRACGVRVQAGESAEFSASRLWVVDASAASHADVKRYLRSGRQRRVILFGPTADDASFPGVTAIPATYNLASIRDQIGQVVNSLESTPHEQANPHSVC